jgi:uncharacterized protein YkwD
LEGYQMNVFLFFLLSVIGNDCTVMSPVESQVVAETNNARAAAGLPPLSVDCRLMDRSRRHARRMANEGFFGHSAGSIENIAYGQAHAQEAVTTWLNSPGHRANMLNRHYTRIGVAGYVGRSGRTYWVQQFAP